MFDLLLLSGNLWFFICAALLVVCVAYAVHYRSPTKNPCFIHVEPVPQTYDWRKSTPIKYRPWKPVYHMVMNVNRTSAEEWLRIENTYDSVTALHKRIMQENPDDTCKANGSMETWKAMQELYDLVFGVLVQRYPHLFVDNGKTITNTIKNTVLPRYAAPSKLNSEQLLRIMMENTEEDFQLLQYDDQEDEFVIRAIGGLTSDGFNWRKKLDHKLTDVHGPVPGYAEKLKTPMNRYFKRMQPGLFMQRLTWGVHVGTSDDVFHPHPKDGDIPPSEYNYNENVYLRVERQIPTKLPKSGFLILTQHTYMYPLSEIKEEGTGPAMADGMDAWPESFATYKGRPSWGSTVNAYLRSEK